MDILSLLEPHAAIAVVSPHPDDETFGCGGLMALAAGRGMSVRPVFCTNGEGIEREPFSPPLDPGADLGVLRKRETENAAEILGASSPIHLALPDGGLLERQSDLARLVDAAVGDLSPSLVLAPWPGEQHGDHVAAAWAAAGAALRNGLHLAFYEVNTPLCPNCWVDIGPVLDRKRSAIMAYRYSLYGQPDVFWEAISGLNAYRSFFFIRRGWHEAFFVPETERDREALLDWAGRPLVWKHGCRVHPPAGSV